MITINDPKLTPYIIKYTAGRATIVERKTNKENGRFYEKNVSSFRGLNNIKLLTDCLEFLRALLVEQQLGIQVVTLDEFMLVLREQTIEFNNLLNKLVDEFKIK